MAGELHLPNFAEKVIRDAVATGGNNALAKAETLAAQGRHDEALVFSALGVALLDISGDIANAFRTGLLPGTEGTHGIPDARPPARS